MPFIWDGEHIDFRQSDIIRLHEMLMPIAGYEYGGQYKTGDNVILEVDAGGQLRFQYQSAFAHSLRNPGLSLYGMVMSHKDTNRKRRNSGKLHCT